MISKLNTRISPASYLAMLALFVALGGVSYAAVGQIGTSEIKNGAVTKKKLRKDAVATAKIAPAAVTTAKIGDDAVTGQKVAEATLGTVPSAALLAGKAPSAFESKGFGGGGDASFVKLTTNTVKTVATQPLPAGTYLILARGGVNNNGEEVPAGETCALAAGGITQQVQFGAFAKNTEPGDREEFSLFVIATLPSGGDAVLSCDTTSKWEDGNVTDPTIAAVSVQP
jgi:hypothetical protein